MTAWGRMLRNVFNFRGLSSEDSPLVRMFRIEYSKEYFWMMKYGYSVTDDVVNCFLESRKIQ